MGYGPDVTDLPSQENSTRPSGPWWKCRAWWIYAAIQAGELRDHDAKNDVRYVLSRETIGGLALPGGRVVAADPYVMDADPEPFTQRVGSDAAEVIAVRANVGEDHERIAALVLLMGSDSISDWVMATVPGQNVSALEPEGYFGYPVDAGTGSFGSPEAMKAAGRVLRVDGGMLEDPVSKALFSDGIGTRSAIVIAPEVGADPVAVCSSGWGDGQYPTWLGINSAGNVLVAVTDFLLTGDPYAAPLPEDHSADQLPKARSKSLIRRWFGA